MKTRFCQMSKELRLNTSDKTAQYLKVLPHYKRSYSFRRYQKSPRESLKQTTNFPQQLCFLQCLFFFPLL